MAFEERFFAVSRFVVNQLDVLQGPESSMAEEAVRQALADSTFPSVSPRPKEQRTVNRPLLVDGALVASLEHRAAAHGCDVDALMDLALEAWLDRRR